jgi:hypothetical protein
MLDSTMSVGREAITRMVGRKVMCFNIPLPKTGPEDETSAIVFVVCCDSYYTGICLVTGMHS